MTVNIATKFLESQALSVMNDRMSLDWCFQPKIQQETSEAEKRSQLVNFSILV